MIHVARFSGALILFVIFFVKLASGILYQDCACGSSSDIQERIIGGWATKPHEFPWLVIIKYGDSMYCVGALINNLYILTAGHCVSLTSLDNINVVAGLHDRSNRDGRNLRVDKMLLHQRFFSHEKYDEYDIGLIKLKSPVKFTHKLSPICLPKAGSRYGGSWATIAGWGRMKYKGTKYPRSLLQTSVQVLTNKQCRKTKMGNFILNHTMCAYKEYSDSCQGDSGGPLMFPRASGQMEAIGVVSWGFGCGKLDSPGMYSKVTYFLQWIYENTRDAAYCRDNY